MLVFLAPLAFAAPFPCGTLERLGATAPTLAHDPPPPPGAVEVLDVRDPFGTDYDDEEQSEHFDLKWGSDQNPSAAQVNGTLDALEDAWKVAIEDMGFDRPAFTNAYKINAYIGNSGGDAPDITGNVAAYTTIDDEGYGYIVIDPDTLSYFDTTWGDAYASSVLEHEFHHIIQFGEGAYFTQEGRWYWEASADWFSNLAVPNAYVAAQDGASFRMLPELPLDYFDANDLSSLAEIHQYSASVFLTTLTDWDDGDWTTIRDSWTQAKSSDVPIDVLDASLENGIASSYTDFARAITMGDLSFSDVSDKQLESYTNYYPDEDHVVTAFADSAGSKSPVAIDADRFPGAFAYNVIQMRNPEPESVIVTFQGDATGSRDTPSSFDVWIVADKDTLLPLKGGAGSVEVPDATSLADLFVIVVSHPGERKSNETFGYTLTLAAGAPPPKDTGVPEDTGTQLHDVSEDNGGCNCSSSRGSVASGWLALLALGISARRRAERSAARRRA